MPRKFNFGAGPATMPESVLTEVQEELLDWNGSGIVRNGNKSQKSRVHRNC